MEDRLTEKLKNISFNAVHIDKYSLIMNRILHITPSLYGGAGNFITSLIYHLQKLQFENTLVTSGDPYQYNDWETFVEKIESSGAEILNLDFFHRESSIFWESCKELIKIVEQGNFDLIHTNSAVPTLGARIALDISGKKIPILATFYSFGVGRPGWMDFADYYSFGRADKVIAISSYCRDLLVENGVPKSKVELVPIGIDLSKIEQHKADKFETRNKLGLPEDEILLIQLAAVEKRKNQMMTIKILQGLKEKSDEKYRLLIVGDKKEKDYCLEIEDYIKSKDLEDVVMLTGKVENPYHYLHAGDIFIFPTLSEGLGLAIIEAMAAKIPVFATYIEGTRDILIDGDNSIVISPDDPELPVEKIQGIIDDRNKREKLCNNAYDLVNKKFEISLTLNKFKDIYSKMMSNRDY